MNFFENELRRIFSKTEGIQNLRYIGRSCYGKLSSDIRLKAEFVTNSVSDQFEVLKVTLINKADGEIDHVKLNLADVIGLKEKMLRKLLCIRFWIWCLWAFMKAI